MTTAITLIVIVVVLLALVASGAYLLRRRQLQQRFGPEYTRAVEQAGDRRSAEKELRRRERRHQEFSLRPIPAAEQQRYAARWQEVQAQFIESPAEAVSHADNLVSEVMAARGYPTEGFDQQVADLSVQHAGALDHYRTAHDLRLHNDQEQLGTEDLRQAVVHYRALFAELLDADPTGNGHTDKARTDDAHSGDGRTTAAEAAPTGERRADPDTAAEHRAPREAAIEHADAGLRDGTGPATRSTDQR